MKLLRADLQVLGNLATTRAGRRLALGTGVGLLLLGMLAWWFAEAVLDNRQVQSLLRRPAGDPVQGLLGYGLLACPLVATWLGLALAQRQLFDAGELQLWRQAPLPTTRPALQVLVRAVFVSTCWALALAGPFAAAVLLRHGAPWWSFALLPIAVLGGTAPLLSLLLAVHVVLVRIFAGRWLRLLFACLGALASVAFSTWLLLTMFTRSGDRAHDVVAAARTPQELPWTVDAGAALLGAAANGRLDPRALLTVGGWVAAAFVVFRLAARLHPRAVERHLAAEPPIWRPAGRRWPQTLAAVVRRKEWAQLLQQPGALIGFLVFAVLVFAMAKERVLVGGLLGNPRVPPFALHVVVMCAQWFLAVLLVLYAHMGRLVLWDGPQWSLWVCSPASPAAILRGKLQAVFVLLLWPLLLVAVAGVLVLDVEPRTLLAFAGIALGGTLVAVGVLAVVGTWPRLMRPDDGHVAQGGRGFLAALLLVGAFELAAAPGVAAWLWLNAQTRHRLLTVDVALAWTPWVVAAAVVYGAVVASLGAWLGARNFRRLLRPR